MRADEINSLAAWAGATIRLALARLGVLSSWMDICGRLRRQAKAGQATKPPAYWICLAALAATVSLTGCDDAIKIYQLEKSLQTLTQANEHLTKQVQEFKAGLYAKQQAEQQLRENIDMALACDVLYNVLCPPELAQSRVKLIQEANSRGIQPKGWLYGGSIVLVVVLGILLMTFACLLYLKLITPAKSRIKALADQEANLAHRLAMNQTILADFDAKIQALLKQEDKANQAAIVAGEHVLYLQAKQMELEAQIQTLEHNRALLAAFNL